MKHYVLGEVVGRGGMGQVHSARDANGRNVVVKRLRNTHVGNLIMTAKLSDEVSMLGRVVHHNVVRLVDSGSEPELGPYLVMDHAGTSLSRLIDRDGPLSVQRAFAIASQMLAGLAAIHDAGVVHADIKSSNVLIDANDRVIIIDFGLARASADGGERGDTVAGTPAYMAPEVISGAVPTPSADLYGAAAILYEMLTGVTPFATASDLFAAHLCEPVVPPSLRAPQSGISSALDRLILRALAKTPDKRFASARELAAALDAAAAADWAMTTMDGFADIPTSQFARPTVIDRARAATVPASSVVADTNKEVIATALDRARDLVDRDDARAAVAVLEDALSALAPAVGTDQSICPEAWRIETVLAALYRGLGRKERARRLATTAYKHALRTGCSVAVARTSALVERFARPTSENGIEHVRPRGRFAKGSARFKPATLTDPRR